MSHLEENKIMPVLLCRRGRAADFVSTRYGPGLIVRVYVREMLCETCPESMEVEECVGAIRRVAWNGPARWHTVIEGNFNRGPLGLVVLPSHLRLNMFLGSGCSGSYQPRTDGSREARSVSFSSCSRCP